MTLTLFIISIIYSYNVDDINAQVNRTQVVTIQSNQDHIDFQPLADINPGKTIESPGNLIEINDSNTDQINLIHTKYVHHIFNDVIIGNRTILSETNLTFFTNSTTTSPTFNPPLKRCSNMDDDKRKGFDNESDLAKHMITGKFDKNKLKGNDFGLKIFSDLVKDDDAEGNVNDYPYKANFVNDQDNKTKVKPEDITTVCIDLQEVVNFKKHDLDK